MIIDAAQIEVEIPSSFFRSETYSVYKSTNTLKGLVDVLPGRYITFLPSLFTVCISNKELEQMPTILLWPTKAFKLVTCSSL